MAIDSDGGVSIYPSVQAYLSVNKRRIRFGHDVRPLQWSVPELEIDPLLAGDVVSGDCILLAGPPATHKFPLGLSFLTSGILTEPDRPVMLISLRQDEPAILRIISEYPQFSALLEAQRKERLFILYDLPDYFTAERFLDRIRRRFRLASRPFSRVLFSTLNQLAHNSPLFAEEKLFVAALIESFRSHHATSLFLGVGSKDSEIENIFDTLLFTEHGSNTAKPEILLSVGHSGPCNAGRKAWALDRQTIEGKGRLVLKPVSPPGQRHSRKAQI
jgi:hypothetical protein